MTEPAFTAPWEARAFALVLALHHSYYDHWLAALERLVVQKDLASPEALSRYRTAWAHAAGRTPHGQPIELVARDLEH